MICIHPLYNYPFCLREEFFLCRSDTGALAASSAACVLELARRDMSSWICGELLQSRIEIASPVFEHIEEVPPGLNALRSTLADIADSIDLRLIAAGTHPLGSWHDPTATGEQHYRQLPNDLRILRPRNLVCGLQVQVAVPPDIDRIDLMHRLMWWAPLFLALSTSSPFWNGHATGLLSYRQSLHDAWLRSGVPDSFQDEVDPAEFAAHMTRAGAMRASDPIWWAMRPTPDFPALELRIADACTYLQDTVALAALFRCLVAAAVRHPTLGRDRTTHTRRIVDENRWRAERDGIDAHFIAKPFSELLSVEQLLNEALTCVADCSEDLECTEALEHLEEIVRRGSSAHRQLTIYEESRARGMTEALALRQVLDWLEATTLQQPAVIV